MSWNNDTDFKVIFTDDAKKHLHNIIDYLFFEVNNAQAAYNVEQDIKETTRMLSHVAGSLKLCNTVSTIHSFLWKLIKNYQEDIQEWVKQSIAMEIEELKID